MKDFSTTFLNQEVPEGKVAVFWLGQAGYCFKTSSGQKIILDPYLSDCCERCFGFKRQMAHILEPKDIVFDQLLVTHAHYDHFDPDSVPSLMENGHTQLLGAKDIIPECDKLGLKKNITTLSVEDCETRGDLKVTAVKCDHGKLAPDALGFILEFGKIKIYVMGDTAYRPDYLKDPRLYGADLLILPINGAFGNLNEKQAAKVASKLKAKLTTPCHFWCFAQHGGNPNIFIQEMKKKAPDCPMYLMRQGEGILVG